MDEVSCAGKNEMLRFSKAGPVWATKKIAIVQPLNCSNTFGRKVCRIGQGAVINRRASGYVKPQGESNCESRTEKSTYSSNA